MTTLPPVVLHEFAGHPAEPSVLLRRWLADAEAAGEDDPFTAVLATAGALGQPSTRCVAVRSVEERGLVMFTNLNTRKGRDLHANPLAAITFYWPSLLRQVNITGHVEQTGDEESDALWDARGLPGQVASSVSTQGAKLDDYELLGARAAELTAAGPPVARPEGQTGIVLVPEQQSSGSDRPAGCITASTTPASARAGNPSAYSRDRGHPVRGAVLHSDSDGCAHSVPAWRCINMQRACRSVPLMPARMPDSSHCSTSTTNNRAQMRLMRRVRA